jgi:hypothetical protein
MVAMTKRLAVLMLCAGALLVGERTAFAAVKTRIILTDNPDFDMSDPKSPRCLARTITRRLHARRNERLVWKVENDTADGNPCPSLNIADVDLDFGTTMPITNKTKVGGKIKAQVFQNAGQQQYKYKITYKGNEAEDPILDISGECGPGCGPGVPISAPPPSPPPTPSQRAPQKK